MEFLQRVLPKFETDKASVGHLFPLVGWVGGRLLRLFVSVDLLK